MARFKLKRPKNTLPIEVAIWHEVMGEQKPLIQEAIGGGHRVDFRGLSLDSTLHCPEIGFTSFINSCAYCSLGKTKVCNALESHGDKIDVPIHAVIYDYCLTAQKSKKMPAKKKPTLVVEINPEKKEQGILFDLAENSEAPINPKLVYRPVIRRYTVKVELVTKGNAKGGSFPKALVLAISKEGQSKGALGTCSQLVKRDQLCNGDMVYELGDPLEFQLKLDKLPERHRKAKVVPDAPKKKKRGRPPKNG